MAAVSRRTTSTTVSTLPRSREGVASSSFTRRASQNTSLPGIRNATSAPAPTLTEVQFIGSQPRNFELGGKQGNVVIASSDMRVHKGWRLVSIDATQLGLHSDAQIRLLLRQTEQKKAKYTLRFAGERPSGGGGLAVGAPPPPRRASPAAGAMRRAASPAASSKDRERESKARRDAEQEKRREEDQARQEAEEARRAARRARVEEERREEAERERQDARREEERLAALRREGEARRAAGRERGGGGGGGGGGGLGARPSAPPAGASRGSLRGRSSSSISTPSEPDAAFRSLPSRTAVANPQHTLLLALASPGGGAGEEGEVEGEGEEMCAPVKKSGPCDKCDGDHHADDCPHFKKTRDKHHDAWVEYGKDGGGKGGGGGGGGEDAEAAVVVVRNARVVRQPGDGACLFHSLAHGVGSSAAKLRGQLASFVEESPAAEIAGTPVKDWVHWDCGLTPAAYAKRMRGSGQWGGAIELAIFSHTNRVAVCVYEPNPGGGYRRISVFGSAARDEPAVHLLYGGRVHYDALEIR